MTGRGAKQVCIGHPANEELDQGLGDTGVDVVVRHVIAHPIGRPAKRQFTQVTGTEDQRIVIVRQAEEVACPLTGLDILEGHIIHAARHAHRDAAGRVTSARSSGECPFHGPHSP